MKKRIFKGVIFGLGAISLSAFLLIRLGMEYVPQFLTTIITDSKGRAYYVDDQNRKYQYGQMYEACWVDNFKERIYLDGEDYQMEGQRSDSAEVLSFGDSFFRSWRERSVPKMLADSLGIKVFIKRTDNISPLQMLKSIHYKKGAPKFLIYESVERFTPMRLDNLFKEEKKKSPKSKWLKGLFKAYSFVKKELFLKDSDKRYTYMIQHIKGVNAIYRFVNTFNFEHFGYISSSTPLYSLDPPMLFYYQTVNDEETGFYHQFSEEDIERYCNNLDKLKRILKEKYNLELIFMPIPNKYTIYHDLINHDTYNNLLPRLYDCLSAHQVKVVKLYEPFRHSSKLLYYRSDSHWNRDGAILALQELMKTMKQ